MVLRGSATAQTPAADARRPLARGDLLADGALLEVAAGAELTVQSTVSAREISLFGPATAEACPGGDEQIRLAVGKVSAFPGTGVRPGAEVWIATPLGVVRFNDAKIDVEVLAREGHRLVVTVGTGRAVFVPAAGVRSAADAAIEETILSPGATFRIDRPPMPLPQLLRDLVRACAQQSAAAEQAGGRVAAASSELDAALGERAFVHVQTRQRARAACEAARAAGGLDRDVLRGPLLVELAAAEAKWKQLTPLPARR